MLSPAHRAPIPHPSKERREQSENHEVSYHPAPGEGRTTCESPIITIGKWETMRFEAIGAMGRMADETANYQDRQ
jgi:hypothetical protein